MKFRPTRIRGRLTLWYVGVFSVLLAAYICGACILQYWQLIGQLYHAEVQDIETVQGLLYFTPDGHLSLHEEYFNRPQSRLLLDRMMEVLDSNGHVLYRNRNLGGAALGGAPLPNEGDRSFSRNRLRLADGTHVLVISHRHIIDNKPLLIRLAYSTEPLQLRLLETVSILAAILPFALIVAGFAGYRVAGRALDPLEHMARLTERITARRLNERIPVLNPADELGHMARVLNGLLERLEESFEKLQRFTSDVSHELRTPLAAMRSVGEVGLQTDHDSATYRDIIGSMLEEVARLTAMVDTLLTIAHADSGVFELHRTLFPFMDLVRESVAVVGVLAEDKGQTVSVDGDAGIQIWADQAFLRMAVINLLDNAVKYSPAGSTIRLALHPVKLASQPCPFVELSIEDQGPGIPSASTEKIFDRFYRLDEARAREAGGVGLGLPIAKWAIQAHGGEISVRSGETCGAVFCIQLPIAEGPLDSLGRIHEPM